jgi:hypothetical protein
MNMTYVNKEIEITSVYFTQKQDKRHLQGYPRRMVWGGREYTFLESGLRYLVRKGAELIQLFDMTDGDTVYRLRLADDQWTLVGMRAGA